MLNALGGNAHPEPRTTAGLVFLFFRPIVAIPQRERPASECARDIDLSLEAIETSFGRSLMRVHRNWLVNVDFVRERDRQDGKTTLLVGASLDDGVRVPVSRDHAHPLRTALLANATGLRQG